MSVRLKREYAGQGQRQREAPIHTYAYDVHVCMLARAARDMKYKVKRIKYKGLRETGDQPHHEGYSVYGQILCQHESTMQREACSQACSQAYSRKSRAAAHRGALDRGVHLAGRGGISGVVELIEEACAACEVRGPWWALTKLQQDRHASCPTRCRGHAA